MLALLAVRSRQASLWPGSNLASKERVIASNEILPCDTHHLLRVGSRLRPVASVVRKARILTMGNSVESDWAEAQVMRTSVMRYHFLKI